MRHPYPPHAARSATNAASSTARAVTHRARTFRPRVTPARIEPAPSGGVERATLFGFFDLFEPIVSSRGPIRVCGPTVRVHDHGERALVPCPLLARAFPTSSRVRRRRRRTPAGEASRRGLQNCKSRRARSFWSCPRTRRWSISTRTRREGCRATPRTPRAPVSRSTARPATTRGLQTRRERARRFSFEPRALRRASDPEDLRPRTPASRRISPRRSAEPRRACSIASRCRRRRWSGSDRARLGRGLI